MSGLKRYKCPACAGTLEFDSGTQQLKCPYCDTIVDIQSVLSQESGSAETAAEPAREGASPEDDLQGLASYVCPSCGGQMVIPDTAGASSCPFCGAPQIVPKKFEGFLKPDLLVPFKLDKKAVKERYFEHLKGKHFLPRVFRSENHISEVRGIYVPFWLFSSTVDMSMQFRCENIRRWEDANYRYVEHTYYDVYRHGHQSFDDVPADGSEHMPDDLMESLEPYAPKEAVPYDPAYLSGFLAHTYDNPAEKMEPRALERMQGSTEASIRSTVTGYDNVNCTSRSAAFDGTSHRYALFPVWLLNTVWNGQRFTFAMNGQTGKFVGNLPLDTPRYRLWFALSSILYTFLFLAIWFVYLASEGPVY